MRKILFILTLVSIIWLSGCYSCKTWMHMQGKEPADPKAEYMWSKGCHPTKAPMPLPEECEPPCGEPTPAPTPKPVPPPPPPKTNCAEQVYPDGGCKIVKLEKCLPGQVRTGTDFEYTIRVTSLTDLTITDVVVTDTPSSNFQYRTANPKATVQGDKLIWVFPTLAPGESREITGIAVATASGELQNCVDVTYKLPRKGPICVYTVSVQPEIAITKEAPAEVSICDPIDYVIKVQNTGSGAAYNLKVIDELPSGIVTTKGSNRVEIPIGTLPAGTARSMSFAVQAQKPGTYVNSAVAVADDGVRAESAPVRTMVKQPVLSITKTGPSMQYLDREATYEITVTNTGDWPAVETIIEDEISTGATFVKASQGGVLSRGKVMWKVAKLNPGATAKMSVTYMPKGIGTLVNTARASAICADAVTAVAKTQVKGVPAILLEVIDLTDPIRIGNEVTYRIMVTNQGSAVGTNIAVQAILEPEMEYVSNSGATRGTFADDTITFTPLPSLAAKARASWEVTVKAVGEADVRFRVKMKSDQIKRDVEETESTNFYK
ncbi:MAG: DUF11 domain-containing protein [Sedimentisphaerales bacterium]|nr:DUF11 domain-containing protein [Sedimentisphaerales bacterium]